jgi:hypothetical protein
VSDLKSDRQRRDLHKLNLPATSRKIGHVFINWYQRFQVYHEVYSHLPYIHICSLPRVHKKSKNISISAVLSPFVPLQFRFRFALLSLCPWSSFVAGLGLCSWS